MRNGLRIIAVILVGIASGGCSGGHSFGVSTLVAGGTDKDGVDCTYSVNELSLDGRVYLILAVDGPVGSSASAGPPARGQLLRPDGRKLDWSCSTADGRAGAVTIDGRAFDLARGGVFLIPAKGSPAGVEQVAVDMARFRGGDVVEELRGLGRGEPRLAAFFARAVGGK